MIDRSILAMPKATFIILFLFCGNFILSGKTAEQCPKNPLKPTNSISGLIVGTIVGTEKLVGGIISYFWYLGENSINQVIGLTSQFEGVISKLIIKLHSTFDGLIGGIAGQIKGIYNGSTGTIRIIFDRIINIENAIQSFVYKQIQSFADLVVSGRLSGKITATVKSPFKSISNGLKKIKRSVSKLSALVSADIKKVVNSVKTSGVPDDIKGILNAPVRGVKTFLNEAKSVIQTVKNETAARFSVYSYDFKKGGLIHKLVAISSVPVGASLEIWSFTLKISEAAKNGVSVAVKDIVQPFIGKILAERLGKLLLLPISVAEGFYNSITNLFDNIGGVISKITGGGRVSVQVNMVIKHPLIVLKNAWVTAKQELKDLSAAILGEGITEELANILGSPEEVISSMFSYITNMKLSAALYSFISTPLSYLEKAWESVKMAIEGIIKGILGEHYTSKLSEILHAPGKTLSNFAASITGGGSFSAQLTVVLTHPLQTILNTWTVLKIIAEEYITSITGGGSLGTQIKTVLTEPVTLAKNIWSTVKKTLNDISNALVGKSVTDEVAKIIHSPLSAISNITASITGGGSISTQLKSFITKPINIAHKIWDQTKSITHGIFKTVLGENITDSISKVFTSPFSAISDFYASLSGMLSSLFNGSASISISGGAGGGGGFRGALESVIEAPIDVLKGIFKGLGKAEKSLVNGLRGVYRNIPIIGGGGSVKVNVKSGNRQTSFQLGGRQSAGQAGGNEGGKGQADVKFSFGGSAGAKSGRRRKRRSVV